MNPLLYGHDPEARIVAVRQLDDSTMRVYFREETGVTFRDEKFFPFFHLADEAYLRDFTRMHWIKRLEGTLYYQFLCAFEEWAVMWDALRHILESYNRSALTKVGSYTELEIVHLTPDPVMQFLMQTGKTLFKKLAFDDLHRLQLDIETYTSPPHRFSNASRKGDRILLIALADNRGWEHLIDGKKLSESDMLARLVKIIQDKDPDVIEGHNIFGFDLPYLQTRARMAGVPLAIGRDGTLPRSFDARSMSGDVQTDSSIMEIPGRHILDTLLLVQSYDASRRTMESYGLKYAARFFGLASAERTYIEGDRISWAWDNEPARLKDYSMDDVREVKALSEHLSTVPFALTSMLPATYTHVSRMGSATKIETLMLREYLRQKHSLPRPSEGAQTTGGYTDLFYTGVLGPILHVDIESLYPSIMLGRQITPRTDALQIFPRLLKDLTERRLEAKRAMQKARDEARRSQLDAAQGSLKILINSFYGYLGYGRGMFNDFAAAD
jgi:DNA polymerase I